MSRTSLLIALGILTCDFGVAAPRSQSSVYIDGNVSTLKPHTGGTLVFTDDAAITFRSGSGSVAVPYANITTAETGATSSHSRMLLQRLHKTQTQLLTVSFADGKGENRTMVLELTKPAASAVLDTIHEHIRSPAGLVDTRVKSDTAWWGDTWWKTTRNIDCWNTQTAAAGTK